MEKKIVDNFKGFGIFVNDKGWLVDVRYKGESIPVANAYVEIEPDETPALYLKILADV